MDDIPYRLASPVSPISAGQDNLCWTGQPVARNGILSTGSECGVMAITSRWAKEMEVNEEWSWNN